MFLCQSDLLSKYFPEHLPVGADEKLGAGSQESHSRSPSSRLLGGWLHRWSRRSGISRVWQGACRGQGRKAVADQRGRGQGGLPGGSDD